MTSFLDVQSAYRAKFGNVPPDSQIWWTVQQVDKLNGDVSGPQQRAGCKHSPRFKAGSELTAKVN